MSSKIKKPQIVGIGEVFFDIMPDCRKLGGAPYDFLRYAVKYGATGSLISAIGADDLGREVFSELQKYNINPILAVTPYPTGRVLIFKNDIGHNAHILENAAWDYIPYTTKAEETIKSANVLYFGTLALRKPYSKNTILDLIDMASPETYKFFDINLRKNYYNKETIIELLNRANILKLNIEELKSLRELLQLPGATDDVCLALKDKYNLHYLILTDSTKESIIWSDNALTRVKNSQITQLFAFGAGNAFAGTFIGNLLAGKSQKEAHETANNIAIDVCQQNQS